MERVGELEEVVVVVEGAAEAGVCVCVRVCLVLVEEEERGERVKENRMLLLVATPVGFDGRLLRLLRFLNMTKADPV